jgi:hypothetical protein
MPDRVRQHAREGTITTTISPKPVLVTAANSGIGCGLVDELVVALRLAVTPMALS